MNREITDFLGAPWAFLVGAAAGLYYSDHYMKSPNGTKKILAIVGAGVAVHFIYRAMAKKDERVFMHTPVQPNDAIKGVKQTR